MKNIFSIFLGTLIINILIISSVALASPKKAVSIKTLEARACKEIKNDAKRKKCKQANKASREEAENKGEDEEETEIKKGNLSKYCPKGAGTASVGILYKPESDVSDFRGGKPAVLLTGGYKVTYTPLSIYARNGTKICQLAYKVMSEPGVNKGAQHFYSGWDNGCGKTGSQLASEAKKLAGTTDIFISWKNGYCIGPLNPTSRSGGI